MSQLLSKISYIICYREASEERKQALHFVLRLLRQHFQEIEIFIVEQDSSPKLELDESHNIKHLFIYNSGLFNRSWAFNCAVKNTTKDIFVFADADIFLEKVDFLKCVNAIQDFEAITPNKLEISNVAIDQNGSDKIHVLNKRKLHTFAGGMLFMTRNAFEKICGWDERFEGWGGEDNAMSHVIYNRLKSKTFNQPNFHIDHPHEFVAGKNQPHYELNRVLKEEIVTRNGIALDRYIHQLKALDFGNPEKYRSSSTEESSTSKLFVLAITTYNRLDYLKKCVSSYFQTRSETDTWQLIIADDNSTDGTKEYLQELEEKHNAIIIHNDRTGIHHQVNTILKTLSTMTFDLCFKCDDDIQFLQKGWDTLYSKTIQRTGYDHLVFYDKNWQPYANLSHPIRFGNLVSNCQSDKIQGAFYTLTKEVIDKVGYFDGQQFGVSGLGHIDFSFRCCRAGFNVLANPFDVENSNDYIQLQAVNAYMSTSSLKDKSDVNSNRIISKKLKLLGLDRVYIPYNENISEGSVKREKSILKTKISNKSVLTKYKKADATFYSERGIIGFLGFLLKRTYNLSIDLKLYFIPISINWLGKALNKISIHLINIEK